MINQTLAKYINLQKVEFGDMNKDMIGGKINDVIEKLN